MSHFDTCVRVAKVVPKNRRSTTERTAHRLSLTAVTQSCCLLGVHLVHDACEKDIIGEKLLCHRQGLGHPGLVDKIAPGDVVVDAVATP